MHVFLLFATLLLIGQTKGTGRRMNAKEGEKGLLQSLKRFLDSMETRMSQLEASESHLKLLLENQNCCKKNDTYCENYRGTISTTEKGLTCREWTESDRNGHHEDAMIANYCRNPDNSWRPWCYLLESDRVTTGEWWQWCEIPRCWKVGTALLRCTYIPFCLRSLCHRSTTRRQQFHGQNRLHWVKYLCRSFCTGKKLFRQFSSFS